MTEQKDYRSTVFLPKTDFPMKAGLWQKEPGILSRWQDEGIYQQIRAARALIRWSAEDLARHSPVSVTTIRRAELMPSATALISASGATIAADLPPSSRNNRFNDGAPSSMMRRPVAVER